MLKILLIFIVAFNSWGLEKPGSELAAAGLKTKLGVKLDENLSFISSEGQSLTIKQIVNQKTTIVVPAYYGCPRLCGLVLDGVVKLINDLKFDIGKEYQVVSISFDPKDTVETTQKFQARYQGLVKKGISSNFRFFTGEEKNIVPLMKTLGFGYVKDRGEFAHSAAIFIVSPTGELSQYFTGIKFPELDVRLALVEASKGLIGSLVEHTMLFCFRFDETKGKYTLAAFNFMRVGAILTLCGLIWLFISLKRKEKGS